MRRGSEAEDLRAEHPADDEEITIKRAVRLPAEARRQDGCETIRIPIDAELLALARGDEPPPTAPPPDDPFGGLIPVEDDEPAPDDPFGGLIPVEDEPEVDIDRLFDELALPLVEADPE